MRNAAAAQATHQRKLRRRASCEDEARTGLDNEETLVHGRAILAYFYYSDCASSHCFEFDATTVLRRRYKWVES